MLLTVRIPNGTQYAPHSIPDGTQYAAHSIPEMVLSMLLMASIPDGTQQMLLTVY